MKQETKAKIKKALKWTGFAVLCAFACFGAVVACASIARNANGAEAKNPAETSATMRADLMPRRADSTAGGGIELGVNLLDDAEAMDTARLYLWEGTTYATYNPNGITYRVLMEEGFYYVVNAPSSNVMELYVDSATNYCWNALASAVSHQENQALPADAFTFLGSVGAGERRLLAGVGGRYLLLTMRTNFDGWRDKGLYRLVDAPAVATYTLPDNWNPYALLGAEPSPNHDGTFVGGLGSVNFDAVTFRSNGMVWNNIYVETLDMENKLVGWYDVNGRLQHKRVTATGARAVASVTYSLTGQSSQASQVVMQYKRVLIDVDGGSEYVYLAQGARYWTSPLYRKIEVLLYNADEWSPSAQYLPASPDLWLERSLADKTTFDPNAWGDPNENVNVFSMIALAFSSMMPFLGIQIFPSMTLGLLVILPLIGGIVILIIKAVSK